MLGIIKTLFTDNNQTVALIPRTTAKAVSYKDGTVEDFLNNMHSATTSFVIASASWPSTTETVDGTAYYIYTINLNHIYDVRPTVMIGSVGTLPTEAEKTAYGLVKYVTTNADTNELKLYAEEKPTSDFVIVAKGVN